jgi:hypothetical protein
MAMGQAAGINAALAVNTRKGIRDVPIGEIQNKLVQIGAVITIP